MMLIQVLVTLFVAFAVSRVALRLRDGSMGPLGAAIWALLWAAVLVFVWLPGMSNAVAHFMGVGRGVDALIYLSIIALFYGVFRLYAKLELMRLEMTSLVRALALKEREERDQGPPQP